MNARAKKEYEHRSVLRDNGWSVSQRDSVAFNGGSESKPHWFAKCAVAFVLKEQGYRVDSEVSKDGVGEIDVVGYATADPPVAVECEVNPTDDVVHDKLERYVYGEPFRDMFLIDVGSVPETFDGAVEYVREEL